MRTILIILRPVLLLLLLDYLRNVTYLHVVVQDIAVLLQDRTLGFHQNVKVVVFSGDPSILFARSAVVFA